MLHWGLWVWRGLWCCRVDDVCEGKMGRELKGGEAEAVLNSIAYVTT
jgi:hypothetical protein